MTTFDFRPFAQGQELSTAPEHWGALRESSDVADAPDQLRARMQADGYIFLRDWLSRADVQDARWECLRRLSDAGQLHPDFPLEDAVAAPDTSVQFAPELALGNAPLLKVLYSGAMIQFYERLLGESVRHFDFTWLRAVSPGWATPPHCDVVYMGRGTQELYTSWTPLGDVDAHQGGLMVLEGSHEIAKLNHYRRKDVDAVCANRSSDKSGTHDAPWPRDTPRIGAQMRNGGWLSRTPATLRERLGGRWLTTSNFQMGDLLVFSVHLVHGSIDNRSSRVRLSSDSRYQRASEPADERWIGASPVGHGDAGKRALIC